MRIRPPELETSICDAKYNVSLALSVIPRGSWGDVARRFTMIRWTVLAASPPLYTRRRRRLVPPPPPPPRVAGIRSGRFDEENPFVQNLSVLLVQADKGVSVLVVDRDWRYLPQSTEKSRRYCNYGWSQARVPASCDSLSCRWSCFQFLSAVRFNRELVLVLYYCSRHLEYFPIANCRDTLATVHRTLSSSIAGGRQLR
ncbi:hypothetical protein F511_15840 [Dorcoceras hygrometricum]|uniref:Uncharacterized protein n=1 Tax=Dorcoceras hygrometricum TaxID=472368 RepID=A0A2Z7B785_9LAMI|nr:hypothetical protein F511_15840 [Dorcoceras hygrometricum]